MEKSVAVLGGAEPAGSASGVLAESTTAILVRSSPTEESAAVLGGAEPAGSASVPIRSAAQMRPDRLSTAPCRVLLLATNQSTSSRLV